MWYFFQLWGQISQQLKLLYALKLQSNKKYITTSVNNVVLFSDMEIYHNSVNNVVLLSVMETYYSTPLINVCSEISIQQKRLPTIDGNYRVITLFLLW